MTKPKLTFQRYSWLLLLLVSPLLLFPSPSLTPALLVIPLVVWVHGRRPSNTILDWPILLLAFMVLVSLYATYDIQVSLPKVTGLLLGVGGFYTTVYWSSQPKGVIGSIAILLAGGSGIAALGLLSTHWSAKLPALQSLSAILPSRLVLLPGAEEGIQPNQLAGALLWVLPLLTVVSILLWHKTSASMIVPKSRRISIVLLATAALLLTLGTFILTQSRGGYIAAALTAFVALLIWLWHRGRRTFLVGLGLLAVTGGALAYYGQTAMFPDSEDGSLVSDSTLSLDTLNGRLEIWSRAIYGIQDFPFTGMGMNTFRHIVPVLYPLFLISPDYDIAHAHNEFLQAALDLGLPGLIAFIALYIGAFWMLSQIWRAGGQNNSLPYRLLALGLGGGLFAHLIYGLTDAVALGAKPGILFWMLLGLIAGLHRQVVIQPDQV